MLKPIGFWSYSSTDDDHPRGRLSRLRALLASELQQKIGRNLKVKIFQDAAAIPAGAEWEKQIRDAIDESFFLIPIVTPSLLQSEWCCQEITLFRHREANALRRADLVIPILYMRIDGLDPLKPEDCHDPEVFRFLRSRHWIDFSTLRHKNPESEEVASRIEAIADAIYLALRRPEQERVEEVSGATLSAQAHQLAQLEEDRREPETDLKAEPAQEPFEAEAKPGEDELEESAADALANVGANEGASEERRDAAAEQDTGQAAQQRPEQRYLGNEPEADGRLGEKEHPIQSSDLSPAWLDTRSWPYLKIAIVAALLGLVGHFSINVLGLEGLKLGIIFVLSSQQALYAATVLLLVAPFTERSKIHRLAVLFLGVYVTQLMLTYAQMLGYAKISINSQISVYTRSAPSNLVLFGYFVKTLPEIVGFLLQWFLVPYAACLKSGYTDWRFLGIGIFAVAAANLVVVIFILTLPPWLSGWVLSAFQSCTFALLFSYGIRNQTSQVR
jgi:TIR domain